MRNSDADSGSINTMRQLNSTNKSIHIMMETQESVDAMSRFETLSVSVWMGSGDSSRQYKHIVIANLQPTLRYENTPELPPWVPGGDD